MGSNVFGDPITDETLWRMPKFEKRTNITSIERALVALNSKNEGDRRTNAQQYVERLRSEWRTTSTAASRLSTGCLVYNATGDPIRFVCSHDYYGIGNAPYPAQIANGQWGAFLHVTNDNNSAPVGSSAAVVYCGKNDTGENCDFMFAWYNIRNGESSENKAYTEIREVGHYKNPSVWDPILDNMKQHDLNGNDDCRGCLSAVTTERGPSPLFEATITLHNADAAA